MAQILWLKAYGLSLVEIARLTHLSPLTVRAHLRRSQIFFGAATVPHAIAIAIRKGIIDPAWIPSMYERAREDDSLKDAA